MSLEDIANVTISTESPGITRQGYGTGMIVGYHTYWTDRLVRTYSGTAEMLADGFSPNHPIYLKAQVFFAQTPTPTNVKVGRLTAPFTQVLQVTPAAGMVEGDKFKFSVYSNGTQLAETSVTAGVSPTATTVTSAIRAVYDGSPLPGVVSSGTTEVSFTCTAGLIVDVKNWTKNLLVNDVTANPGTSIVTQLNNILIEDDDWYGLVCAIPDSQALQKLVADWLETQNKIYVLKTSDYRALSSVSTADIGYVLKGQTQGRTVGVFRKTDTGSNIDAALLGNRLTADPGSDTWSFKGLVGVLPDTYSSTEKNTLKAKNYTLYYSTSKKPITMFARVFGGEKPDVVRFIDWFKTSLQEDVVEAQVSNPKIPYTGKGISTIENLVRSRHAKGVDIGGLSPDVAPVITVPKIENVSQTDKQNRVLNGVRYQGKLAGAIELVNITARFEV